MMRLSSLLLSFALLIITGCETATPYKAAHGSDFGYSEQQIESKRWAIRFSGNSITDKQTVETYLIFRAAELTTENGFDFFEVVRRDVDEETSFTSDLFATPFFYSFHGVGPHQGFHVSSRHLAPTPYQSRGRALPGTYYDPFFGGPAAFQERVSYTASAEILMRSGQKPDAAAFFDATDVINTLGPSITKPTQ